MKSVVISVSLKFFDEMMNWANALKSKGVKVYHPEDFSFKNLKSDELEYAVSGTTYGYFQKIRKADVMLLFNIDGYAGTSTTLELGYATACAKPVVSLEKDPEPARNVLIDRQVTNVEELLEFLAT